MDNFSEYSQSLTDKIIEGGADWDDRIDKSIAYDRAFESRKWTEELPFFEFPSHWQVKIIPPFAMAVVRFFIRTKKMPGNQRISVYFDAYNLLGSMPHPYWEVYPIAEDTVRFHMNNVKGLIDCINEELTERGWQ